MERRTGMASKFLNNRPWFRVERMPRGMPITTLIRVPIIPRKNVGSRRFIMSESAGSPKEMDVPKFKWERFFSQAEN
jgi:hypothetical protein